VNLLRRIKETVIGAARSPHDKSVFRQVSLIAFFAWVGLGSDGLSSSCYGPAEAFLELQSYPYLGLIIALATVLTVLVISASYSQIIELFPAGGGGYLVASKLLSPSLGMISGCALLVDYVLTISVSVASGADAILSFLPPHWYGHKLWLAGAGVAGLTIINLRGVRESVVPLVPIFLGFLLLHAAAIVFGLAEHVPNVAEHAGRAAADFQGAFAALGGGGVALLVLHAYSMGAGTYTGIEAVSNGMPMLREPRVHTAKKTMRYMAISLAITASGLMVAYILYGLKGDPTGTKTVNALLFERLTEGWGNWGKGLVLATLISEAAILFVAAQTGFLGGPRVAANMAGDRWFPTRFGALSDRLVTQNGVLLMGLAALIVMLATGGSVRTLVILYSINVFITFVLSQAGMVRHWLGVRRSRQGRWAWPMTINTVGLVICAFILASVVVVKFHEGGWLTLLVTGGLVLLCAMIRRHYQNVRKLLARLDDLRQAAETGARGLGALSQAPPAPAYDPTAKTAVLLVNRFDGLGLHSLFNIMRLFGETFRNFVFLQVGQVDAGNFKGAEELRNLDQHVKVELDKYVDFVRRSGYFGEAYSSSGVDVLEEIVSLGTRVLQKYPQAVFFGGQLVFPQESFGTRMLHNYMVFAVQRRFYRMGAPFVILPVRV
jgi:hypothetical protein